jgi:2-polyprenyl-6-hydroxyphenyl methylase/3-demethylubiquinone-9 3-methyltransferase
VGPAGEFRPLHEINPLRLGWIDARAPLEGKSALDVGCGGGILTEAMAQRSASVSGIDLGEKALRIAQVHMLESGVQVRYEAAVMPKRLPKAHSGAVRRMVTAWSLLEQRARASKHRVAGVTRDTREAWRARRCSSRRSNRNIRRRILLGR